MQQICIGLYSISAIKMAQILFTRNKKYTLIAFLFLRENPHLEVI